MKRKLILLGIILTLIMLLFVGCNDTTSDTTPTNITIGEFSTVDYYLGESLNLGNAELIVTYANGWSRRVPITEDMISGYNSKATGAQQITVAFGGLTTTVKVTVAPLSIQSIDAVEVASDGTVTLARPIRVVEGAEPDYSKIAIRVNYETMSVIQDTILPDTISGYSAETCVPRSTPYPITITYGGKSTTVQLYVIARSVQSISVAAEDMPTKINYFYNDPVLTSAVAEFNAGKAYADCIHIAEGERFSEEFDPEGLTVTVTYDNGDVETVDYEDIPDGEIDFDYNFSVAAAESNVTITYLEQQCTITVSVISAVTTGMDITTMPSSLGRYSFVKQLSAEPAPSNAVLAIPKRDAMDVSAYYIVRTPEADVSEDSMVQGDVIDWGTGKATVVYSDGTELSNVPLDYNDIKKSCTGFSNLVDALDKTGAYTIKITYANASWSPVEIGITIEERSAIELFLAEKTVNTVTNKTYYEGDSISVELIKYNAFYDNGTFLYGDMTLEEYKNPANYVDGENVKGTIAYSDWADASKWSIDANGNVNYSFTASNGNGYGWAYATSDMLVELDSDKCENAGNHEIQFVLDGVKSKTVGLQVNPLLPARIDLVQSYSYYFVTGSTTAGFYEDVFRKEVNAYVSYTNGASDILSISTDQLTLCDADGTELYNFSSPDPYTFANGGEYMLVVAVDGCRCVNPISIIVEDTVVTSMTITEKPTATSYDKFEDLENQFADFKFYVTYSDGSAKYLAIGSGAAPETLFVDKIYSTDNATDEDAITIICDKNKIGSQDITFRYKGQSAKYAATIVGRWERTIDIVSLPKQYYYYGTDTEISLSGLKVRVYYNDGSYNDVSDFSDTSLWSFKYPSLTMTDNTKYYEQKTLTVILNGKKLTVKRDVKLELLNGQITAIAYDDTQSIFKEYMGYDNATHNMLSVAGGSDLDLSTFVLKVTYSYINSLNETVSVVEDRTITSANVNYDKNTVYYDNVGNVINSRLLTISYCGKTAKVWLFIDAEKVLTGIELVALPTQVNYAVGQTIDLRGGIIRRSYLVGGMDVATDTIAMTNSDIVVEYNSDAFAIGSALTHEDREVVVYYGNYSVRFDVTTYSKLTATISYENIVLRYGSVTAPHIYVKPSNIAGFDEPSISWLYGTETTVGGATQTVWSDKCPSVPGSYLIKVSVEANDYYNDSEETDKTLYIAKKSISIAIDSATKYYGEQDPSFTYYLSTNLIGSDVIDIKLLRKAGNDGENVKFSADGAILGYNISYELVDGNNQNGYYDFIVTEGTLIINPKQISGNVVFTGLDNLTEDGTKHPVTAYYLGANNMRTAIAAKDIIYTVKGTTVIVQEVLLDSDGRIVYDEQGNPVMVNCAPTAAGAYTATISSNYVITGTYTADFNIA